MVRLPPSRKALLYKWVYKVILQSYRSVERLKTYLVIRGDMQKEGCDFKETFSPIVKITTMICVLAITIKRGWNLFQLDVNNAFLHGDLEEKVYIKFLPGIQSPPFYDCHLRNSLYCLKQACRQWYARLTVVLEFKGYAHLSNDYSLFYKLNSAFISMLIAYVDDIVLTGDDIEELQALKSFLLSEFQIKDLGSLHYFIGMEVTRESTGLILNQ